MFSSILTIFSSPSIVFLLIIWIFYTVHRSHTCFHSFQVDLPTLVFYPWEKYTKPHLCCQDAHWTLIKLPVASPLGETEFFPIFLPEVINCEELHFSIFITILKDHFSFNSFLSELFLLGEGGCLRSLQRLLFSVMSLESSILLQNKLPCSKHPGSVDPGFPRGFRWQPWPPTSTWFSVLAWTIDISAVSTRRHEPWTPTWPLVVAWTMEVFQGGLI